MQCKEVGQPPRRVKPHSSRGKIGVGAAAAFAVAVRAPGDATWRCVVGWRGGHGHRGAGAQQRLLGCGGGRRGWLQGPPAAGGGGTRAAGRAARAHTQPLSVCAQSQLNLSSRQPHASGSELKSTVGLLKPHRTTNPVRNSCSVVCPGTGDRERRWAACMPFWGAGWFARGRVRRVMRKAPGEVRRGLGRCGRGVGLQHAMAVQEAVLEDRVAQLLDERPVLAVPLRQRMPHCYPSRPTDTHFSTRHAPDLPGRQQLPISVLTIVRRCI